MIKINEEVKAAALVAWRETAECGPLEIRRALRSLGKLADVVAYIELQDEEVQESWEYAGLFKRNDPLVLVAQQVIGATDEEMDELFKLAVTLG